MKLLRGASFFLGSLSLLPLPVTSFFERDSDRAYLLRAVEERGR